MTIVDNRTSGRGWLLPNKSNRLKDDVERLTTGFTAADADVTDILLQLGLKASLEHEHEIGEIIGLIAVLNGKMPAGFHDTLDGLTDVSVSGAASGQVLIKQGTGWIPISLQPGNIAGLEALLAGKATPADLAALKTDLLGGAGTAFDTLGELAALLGNDPNFATTLTTALASKLAKAANLSDLADAVTARANLKIVTITTAAYAALASKDAATIYFVT